jgi:hypothetical protein
MNFLTVLFLLLGHTCTERNGGPDPICTPGDVETMSVEVVCGTSTRTRRSVSESERRQVFASYGIVFPPPPGAYELDHLIPLELGGSNDVKNLWPEAAPGYREKDIEENFLHREVCSGRMSLEVAQAKMRERAR